MQTNNGLPNDWVFMCGNTNGKSQIYKNKNWSDETVYHLVINGEYIQAGYEKSVAELRHKVLGDRIVTLQDLLDKMMDA